MREKYESLALVDLKAVAKARGLRGISTMKKDELVEAMLAADEKDGTEIYYDTEIKRAGTDTYKVTTVFYSDSAKTEKTGKTVLTVEDSSGRAIIKKMTSSK
mgnify:CR=1 FL=1